MEQGRIIKVSGPLVIADHMRDAKMFEIVKVSKEKLLGEIIEIRGDQCSIQVYEETEGVGPGDPVYLLKEPLSVTLMEGRTNSGTSEVCLEKLLLSPVNPQELLWFPATSLSRSTSIMC